MIQSEAIEKRRWNGSGTLVEPEHRRVENPQGSTRSPIVLLDEERLVFRSVTRVMPTRTYTDDEVVEYRRAGQGEEAHRPGGTASRPPSPRSGR